MSSTPYISIHSGQDIDRAVSYFNAIGAVGRTLLTQSITQSNWTPTSANVNEEISEDSFNSKVDWQKAMYIKSSNNKYTLRYKYYMMVTLTGQFNIPGTPLLSLVSNGVYYNVDYFFKQDQIDINKTFYLYSNNNISGTLSIITNISDKYGSNGQVIRPEVTINVNEQEEL